MDWLSFTSNLIEHSAWPISFILAIVLLRNPIVRLLSGLQTLKVKDVELNFSETIKSIQKDVPSAKDNKAWEITSTKDLKPNMQWLAEKTPLAVILQAWDSLELNNQIKEGYINIFYRLQALKVMFSNHENVALPKERALEYSDMTLSIAREIQDACNA